MFNEPLLEVYEWETPGVLFSDDSMRLEDFINNHLVGGYIIISKEGGSCLIESILSKDIYSLISYSDETGQKHFVSFLPLLVH